MARFVLAAILLAAVALCVVHGASNSSPKIGARLNHYLTHGDQDGVLPKHTSIRRSDGSNAVTTAIWIIFKDKCGSGNDAQVLSAAAIARRAKHGQTFSDDDKPVCAAYKFAIEDAIKSLPHRALLRNEVRWVNGVSYTIAVSDIPLALSLLTPLSFVSEVEIVGRTVRSDSAIAEEASTSQHSFADASAHLVHNNVADVVKKQSGEALDFNYGTSRSQLERIGIPHLHALHLNGSGVIIAVFDTGFNRAHESLLHLKIDAVYDFVYNDTNVDDETNDAQGASRHGTAALSNIAAMSPGNLYGGSFGATFLLAKTEDTRTETSLEEDNFARAIEWSEAKGADIISASLGYDTWHSFSDFDGKTSVITRAGNRAVDLGVLFIVANGNAGVRGIGTPADMDRVLSLGALGSTNTELAYFSSRGPTSDSRIKPDVSAPGSSIKVAFYQDPAEYVQMSGTSFATPLTAGVAGLLLQSHPEWTNRQLRDAILYSANKTSARTPNIEFGFGVVDAVAANAFNPKTDEEIKALCVAPYGSWNESRRACVCSGDYYNSDCRTQKLACRSWCPGLCLTPERNATCSCTKSAKNRCVSNPTIEAAAWTCPASRFANGTACECGCGLFDPDCDNPRLPIVGCSGNATQCIRDPLNTAIAKCSESSPAAEPVEPSSEGTKKNHKYGILASIVLSIFGLIMR